VPLDFLLVRLQHNQKGRFESSLAGSCRAHQRIDYFDGPNAAGRRVFQPRFSQARGGDFRRTSREKDGKADFKKFQREVMEKETEASVDA